LDKRVISLSYLLPALFLYFCWTCKYYLSLELFVNVYEGEVD
jgi:hypothetical protein